MWIVTTTSVLKVTMKIFRVIIGSLRMGYLRVDTKITTERIEEKSTGKCSKSSITTKNYSIVE